MTEIIELTASDPDPVLAGAGGVTPIPAQDRLLHRPDRSLLLVRDGRLGARLSCWWSATAIYEGQRIGAIGHYAAAAAADGSELLDAACALLRREGVRVAVGPMDGNTWRRYRFIVERGSDPPFALEPDNPDDYPAHWAEAGFETFAAYASAMNDAPGTLDPKTDAAVERLREAGIRIAPLRLEGVDAQLGRIHELSLRSFSDNFLYSPIGREEFIGQYQAVMPWVNPELVLLAEQGERLVGYMFALPDLLQRMRGGVVDTVILKTLAVDPSVRCLGLGGALLDLAQRSAHRLGFRRAVHALFHESNVSGRISARYARRIRRYALFSRALTA